MSTADQRHPDRRAVTRSALAAGLLTTVGLPSASAAASSSPTATGGPFETGFAIGATAGQVLNSWGLTLEPSTSGPSGTGTPPESGNVRLVALTIPFLGGSGTKANVSSPGRDLAVYPTLAKRSGAAVPGDAIGGVVSSWGDATAVGASGTETWLRYEFLSGNVLLDVETQYFVAPISGDAAFTNGTFLGGSLEVASGTSQINSVPSVVSAVWILARAAFTV